MKHFVNSRCNRQQRCKKSQSSKTRLSGAYMVEKEYDASLGSDVA